MRLMSLVLLPLPQILVIFKLLTNVFHFRYCRNIVTHHAEDGSGVGSAIIAGKLPLLLFLPGSLGTVVNID